MRIISLELDYNAYKIYINFDKLDSLSIEENLQVCTSETIRGKNKTFNAFLKPITMSVTGEFSDRVGTNIEVIGEEDTGLTYRNLPVYEEITRINTLIGREKSAKLNKLFKSMVNDTRLCNVKLFYKTYENFIINNFSLNYTDNSTIKVDLSLQEILLRDLEAYVEYKTTYSQIEKITKQEVVEEVTNNITKVVRSFVKFISNIFKRSS